MDNLSIKQKEHQIKYAMDTVKIIATIKDVIDLKDEIKFEDTIKKYREPISFISLHTQG